VILCTSDNSGHIFEYKHGCILHFFMITMNYCTFVTYNLNLFRIQSHILHRKHFRDNISIYNIVQILC